MKFDYFLAVRAWKFLFLIYCGAILFYLAAPLAVRGVGQFRHCNPSDRDRHRFGREGLSR